jgi:CTP:molybdopterin cytidylyltransferase MocA
VNEARPRAHSNKLSSYCNGCIEWIKLYAGRAAAQHGAARQYPFPAVTMLQGDKGARDLIATARKNILEFPAGDPAIEIDIDTKEGSAPASRLSSDMRSSGHSDEIFFRHTACLSSRRNSVLM